MQTKYDLEALYAEYPEAKERISSNGKDQRLKTNALTNIPAFHTYKEKGDVGILGLIGGKREIRYIRRKFLAADTVLERYKVLVPKSNGSGALGECLSTPLIGEPLIGYTQTFIAIGTLATKKEVEALLKYIKTKFARVMLGTMKVTQDNNKPTWKNVPRQDFTAQSDIDWSRSVAEIDQQLYAKYKLDQKEIDFIETNVQAMV